MNNFDNYECDGQMNIFDVMNDDVEITKKIRLIELFAGYGSQAMALKRLGADFEHYRVVEFDKYACNLYNNVHGTDFKPTDICDIKGVDLGIVDKEYFTYLLTYSFPCTDLSVAGEMKGMVEGSGTRSSLLWEVKRLLNECDELPDILLMENVSQVHSQTNMPHFRKWLDFLDDKGYSTFWRDLNSKDYGVAQNRNRTFVVSILDKNVNYTFPRKIKPRYAVANYIDEEVDERFYLKDERAKPLIDGLIKDGKLDE